VLFAFGKQAAGIKSQQATLMSLVVCGRRDLLHVERGCANFKAAEFYMVLKAFAFVWIRFASGGKMGPV